MTHWNDVGGNPAPGEPQQIRNAANHFGELSTTARRARSQLAALQRGELQQCWTGVAADAFAAELDILPADLGKLERSLDHASTAMHRWASSLDQYQDVAESELRKYRRAELQLDDARDERDRERLRAADEAAADPAGAVIDLVTGNERLERLGRYDDQVSDAANHVRRVRRNIEQIRDDVDATARTVARLLDEASRLGIQNKGWIEKAAEWFEALGETLMAVLKFLDELVDLLAPWVGMALFILSFVNPAFAVAALAFAALDFALTAARAGLGDEDVTMKDLFDDGVDLALAMVGAKGAGAGLKGFKALKGAKAAKAAGETSKLVKVADAALDVVGGVKATGDYYLNLADAAGVGPGSSFELVFDLVEGDTASWAPGEGDPYGADFIDAANDLVDASENLIDKTGDLIDATGDLFDPTLPPGTDPIIDPSPGPDPIIDPGPGPDPIIDPGPGPDPIIDPGPGPDPIIDPGPGPDPITDPGPGPDPIIDPGPGVGENPGNVGTPAPGSGSDPIIGVGTGSESAPDMNFAAGADAEFEVALAPPFDAAELSPIPGTEDLSPVDIPPADIPSADTSPAARALADIPVADASQIAAADMAPIASTTTSDGSTNRAAIVGAGAVAAAAAAAGAKRLKDTREDAEDPTEDSTSTPPLVPAASTGLVADVAKLTAEFDLEEEATDE